jgi:hypothetical protein
MQQINCGKQLHSMAPKESVHAKNMGQNARSGPHAQYGSYQSFEPYY